MGVSTFTPNIHLSDFALKLRRDRIWRNLSYETLGEKIGIAPTRLFYFETDKELPTKRERKAIEKFFN